MDDLLKRTTIKTKGKLTKEDLIDFHMWVCTKAQRMGFGIEHREPKENPADTKKEYIKKITG